MISEYLLELLHTHHVMTPLYFLFLADRIARELAARWPVCMKLTHSNW